jgi:signal transduction histidine kinase
MSYVIFRYSIDELSAFPRWYDWYNLWVAIAVEVGAIAFMTRTGPFARDGALVFWMPFVLFFTWVPFTCWLMWRAITRQQIAAQRM